MTTTTDPTSTPADFASATDEVIVSGVPSGMVKVFGPVARDDIFHDSVYRFECARCGSRRRVLGRSAASNEAMRHEAFCAENQKAR